MMFMNIQKLKKINVLRKLNQQNLISKFVFDDSWNLENYLKHFMKLHEKF